MRTDEELRLLAQDIKRGQVLTSEHSKLMPDTVANHFLVLKMMKPEQFDQLEKENCQVFYEYNNHAVTWRNGLPVFMTARYLTREEWKKVCEFHNAMKDMPAEV